MSCDVQSNCPRDYNAARGDEVHSKCREPNPNLYGDLCNKFQNLYQKWYRNQPKRRIQELAMPKYRRMKFRPYVYHNWPTTKPRIQIIRDKALLSTRAEQLAYSPVRKLIANRDSCRGSVSPVIYERFNKYIHRGMYSMYARLANALPPVIINPIKPWSKEDWEKYTEKLKKLSLPKKILEPPKIVRKTKPLSAMEGRIDALATPKSKPKKIKPRPEVNPAALKYEATERIQELSKPKPSREIPARKPKRFRGKKYEASDRTKELAKHREKKTAVSDTKENPFQVSPNALKARTSERVKTLAKPKDYSKQEPKDPLKISPAALKAKASKRIIELAVPKNPRTKA